ncbi:MAG: two-component system, OmpR family, phosphate regulon sensor histidine kinase PhoR [Sphingomonadales bacterium]|jgi:two-component system phosphate regulon sensor histidine kinase PhoR|nr:two-component system, OmpR family, phosphate regulon sensor histidine kinase PhoR [Sphingomonadales bacterium]
MDETASLRDLIEALPEPSLIVSGRLVAVANAAARTVLGEHIVGQDVRFAVRHPVALERLGEAAPASDEVELVGVGGAERRWMMSVALLADGSRFVRLTDRSEAHAAERMRVDFVANASHELRTPLATIFGYAETLDEEDGDLDAETRRRFTSIIHDETRRMQRVVEDLISLSRIEAERFTPPSDKVDLAAFIEEAVRDAKGEAGARGCIVRCAVEDGLPPVLADRVQVHQLLDNLVGNAVRYGSPGPVTVRAELANEHVVLTVADEGEGIAAEHIPRLTERFYRVDPSRSRSQGGTGLGLSIVKHIVERHRGRLSIESRVGEGTTVRVLLPVARDPA